MLVVLASKQCSVRTQESGDDDMVLSRKLVASCPHSAACFCPVDHHLASNGYI